PRGPRIALPPTECLSRLERRARAKLRRRPEGRAGGPTGEGRWQRAEHQALDRSANPEAAAHFSRGLELLRTLSPALEREERELELLIALIPALRATEGLGADVEEAFRRAQELCHQLGETPARLFPVLWGLWYFHLGRSEYATARTLAVQ